MQKCFCSSHLTQSSLMVCLLKLRKIAAAVSVLRRFHQDEKSTIMSLVTESDTRRCHFCIYFLAILRLPPYLLDVGARSDNKSWPQKTYEIL